MAEELPPGTYTCELGKDGKPDLSTAKQYVGHIDITPTWVSMLPLLHVAMQKARGKTPLPFDNWLIFFQAGRQGGNMSGSDKSAAGKRSAEVRRANAEKRKLQPVEA